MNPHDEQSIIHESLTDFVTRKVQSDDLFEMRRTQTDWEILWIWNKLMSEGELHTGQCLDRNQRLANAQKIWDSGRRYAWADAECSFTIFFNILHFVGLKTTNA